MAVTTTGNALITAIKKRSSSEGIDISNNHAQSLMLDIMVTITANSGSAVSDATTEIAANPQRPFVYGV
jgi:hypothetical protein